MKRTYFIKHDQRIRQIIGCDRATLIFDRLEFYSSRQPEGFYKFIEPNSHRLYKKDDSWTELLDCHRTSFWRAFKLIGKKHTSRWTFEASEDKFDGKLYASYYDRLTNRMFFVRNHDAVKEFFAQINVASISKVLLSEHKKTSQISPMLASNGCSVCTEQNAHSYKEPKNTSSELFKNNSHASNETTKKMIDIWLKVVEGGREQLNITRRLLAFLRQALKDKFESSLEKWKKYCQDIASSRFLMGEIKPSFRATLDWALKFDVIQKILDGNYGIGDRTPKAILPSQVDLQEEILNSEESQEIKDFRTLCLQTVGNANYISNFKKLNIEFREEGEIALIAPHKFGADFLEQNCYSYLRLILEGLEGHITRITILAPGEVRGRLIERKNEGRTPPEPSVEYPSDEEFSMEEIIPTNRHLPEVSLKDMLEGTQNLPEYEPIKQDADFLANLNGYGEEGVAFKDIPSLEISLKTKELRDQLKKNMLPRQFPTWLGGIEVEEVGRDGAVVVALEDSFAVEWCRSRFSKEVFEAAATLWKGVNKLIIRQKESRAVLLPIEDMQKKSDNLAQKPTLEQAIQSLLSVCSSRSGKTFGMQGVY